MKRITWPWISLILILFLTLASTAYAQGGFTLSRSTVDNGGGTLNAGGFTLTGAIGQPDASVPRSGGGFSLTGGIFAGVAAIISQPVDLYLPLIFKDFAPAPDLVATNLEATSSAVTVTVQNIGNGPVGDAFWLDVYFNPNATPSLNQRWQDIAPAGAVWGVTGAGLNSLTPGGTLTLTSGGAYYFPNFSSAPPWPVGANVFAQVDSVNYSTSYGAVQESNESNNVFGPVASTTADGRPTTAAAVETPSLAGLPER
jgi:hypothetical protein